MYDNEPQITRRQALGLAAAGLSALTGLGAAVYFHEQQQKQTQIIRPGCKAAVQDKLSRAL